MRGRASGRERRAHRCQRGRTACIGQLCQRHPVTRPARVAVRLARRLPHQIGLGATPALAVARHQRHRLLLRGQRDRPRREHKQLPAGPVVGDAGLNQRRRGVGGERDAQAGSHPERVVQRPVVPPPQLVAERRLVAEVPAAQQFAGNVTQLLDIDRSPGHGATTSI